MVLITPPPLSAYKSHYPTEASLLSIKSDIHLSLSRGESTALVLLAFLAAFDTIDHSTLVDCLKSWGQSPQSGARYDPKAPPTI